VIYHKNPFVFIFYISSAISVYFIHLFSVFSSLFYISYVFLSHYILPYRIHVTKACDSYSFYFSSHLYSYLILIAIYFRFVSSLRRFAPLNAGTTVNHRRHTDRFYYATCYVNQTVVGLNEHSPADHEPIIHCAVK
jgi:hypothetical protein